MNQALATIDNLDPSFDTDGIVDLPFPGVVEDVPCSVLALPDNTLLLAIRAATVQPYPAAVARLNEAGQLDRSFAEGGIRKIPFPNGFFDPKNITPAANGGWVITGQAVFGFNDEFAAVRLLQDGRLDTTFGGTGVVIVRPKELLGFASDQEAQPLSRQPAEALHASVTDIGTAVVLEDGKTLLAGSIFISPGRFVGFVVRLNNDGTPDRSFNQRGCTIVEPPTSREHSLAFDVVVQADGKVLVCGQCYDAFVGNTIAYVTRFDSGGTVDVSFGDGKNGMVVIEADDLVFSLSSLVLKADEGIFASGTTPNGGLIIALNKNGSFNLVFNDGKPLISNLPGQHSSWSHCHLLEDGSGRLVVTGAGNNDVLVTARYLSNGALDRTFGGEGWITFSDPRGRDHYVESTVMADNRVVVCATVFAGPSYVLRYLG